MLQRDLDVLARSNTKEIMDRLVGMEMRFTGRNKSTMAILQDLHCLKFAFKIVNRRIRIYRDFV